MDASVAVVERQERRGRNIKGIGLLSLTGPLLVFPTHHRRLNRGVGALFYANVLW